MKQIKYYLSKNVIKIWSAVKRFCLYLGWKTEVKPFFFWGQAPNSRSRQQSEPVASLASVLLTGSWTHSRQLPPLQPACFFLGFPGGSFSEESASSTVEPGSIPGWGRSPGGGNGNPLQYSCLGNPTDRSLEGYSPGVAKVRHLLTKPLPSFLQM